MTNQRINPLDVSHTRRIVAIIIMETIEDTVEHICDTEMLSGEKVWVMISALADLHINQFPNS